jgi:hypothetical protein
MKKLFFALAILSAGGVLSAQFNHRARSARSATEQRTVEYGPLTERVRALTTMKATFSDAIQDKKTRIKMARASVGASASIDADVLKFIKDPTRLQGRGVASSKVRDLLGVGWNSSADYVLVSKAALKRVWLIGTMDSGALRPAVCDMLALTSQERAAIEAAHQRAEAIHAAWFDTAVQRVTPSEEVVAQYEVPANPDLAQKIQQEELAPLADILGQERFALLQQWDGAWISEHGDLGARSVRLTVHNTPSREPPLWYQVESERWSSGSDVAPDSFPPLFRGAFPGGWPEIAQRDGFQLPDDFQTPNVQ